MNNFKINIISIITLLVTVFSSEQLKAQQIEITPYAGYQTAGKVATTMGYLRVADGMNFGGAISFGMDEDAQIEFTYNHLNSELSTDNGEYIINTTPVNVDYYMLGALKAQRLGERFLPYAGFSLGWVHYGTPEKDYGNLSLFAFNLSVGLKILFSERIGFRMQARLLMPLYYSGAYFATGSAGATYGVSSTCVMVQGDFTGGLFIVL
jgi:hypothetical protein